MSQTLPEIDTLIADLNQQLNLTQLESRATLIISDSRLVLKYKQSGATRIISPKGSKKELIRELNAMIKMSLLLNEFTAGPNSKLNQQFNDLFKKEEFVTIDHVETNGKRYTIKQSNSLTIAIEPQMNEPAFIYLNKHANAHMNKSALFRIMLES